MTARIVRWEGDAIPALASAEGDKRSRVTLDLDNATLLPDPAEAMWQLRRAFELRGRHPAEPDLPNFQVRDVVALANFITMALRHDLPTSDRKDTAVIWDKWRTFILRTKPFVLGAVGTRPFPEPFDVHHTLRTLEDDLRIAMRTPGEVARHYCPWAADFFNEERLYPEAG